MIRLIQLVLLFVFLCGFAAGFYFDRQLHRPIQVQSAPGAQAPGTREKLLLQRTELEVGPLSESPRNVESPL